MGDIDDHQRRFNLDIRGDVHRHGGRPHLGDRNTAPRVVGRGRDFIGRRSGGTVHIVPDLSHPHRGIGVNHAVAVAQVKGVATAVPG